MPRVSDLFDLEYGHSLELNRLRHSKEADAVNFVGRAVRNNGVTARVQPIPGLPPAAAGTISVALGGQGGAGTAFLQPQPYYCGRDVMILTAKSVMTEQVKLWWATCINANRFRFGFGRQANRSLKDLHLPDEVPAWVEKSDTNCYDGAEVAASNALVSLRDPSEWSSFVLGELFDIRKGQRLTKANRTRGKIPYVGASDTANGVTDYVGQSPIHQGNTLSVTYNGSVAEAFYQPEPFWASDDVNVLYPRGFEINPWSGLFLCTVIRREKYRFNYGRKWHLERMREAVIKLPVAADGKPDWGHMEAVIKSLPFSSRLAA